MSDALMLDAVYAALWFCLTAYFLSGGVDFGAGLLPLFIRQNDHKRRLRELAARSIGPIWEANHIWLIIAVVIFFFAFPRPYRLMSVELHLPVILLLVAVIIRGSVFVFAHYDPLHSRHGRLYNAAFSFSSFFAPFMLGVLLNAMMSGRLNPGATGFFERFIAQWFNPGGLFTGLFTAFAFSSLAGVYLLTMAEDDEEEAVTLKALQHSALPAALSGLLVLLTVIFDPAHGLHSLVDLWPFLAIGASAGSALCYYLIRRRRFEAARVAAIAAALFVLCGLLAASYPALLYTVEGGVSYRQHHAEPAAIRALFYSLCTGLVFILPALVWLLLVFKPGSSPKRQPRSGQTS